MDDGRTEMRPEVFVVVRPCVERKEVLEEKESRQVPAWPLPVPVLFSDQNVTGKALRVLLVSSQRRG